MIFDQIGGRGNTILIVAPRDGTIRVDAIEPYNNIADILISYTSPQSATITAIGRYHQVTIIGTNQYFAAVMSHFMTDQVFFTYEALEHGHNVAVLNTYAAISIFEERRASGNIFYLDGKSFQVIGVVYDRDSDNANIYVPITSITSYGELDALAFNVGIAYFHNQPGISIILQELDITEESYHFINLFAAYVIIENYHVLTITLFILVIFEAITSKAIKIGIRNWRIIAKLIEGEVGIVSIIFSRSFFVLLAAAGVVVLIFWTIGAESSDIFMSISEIINTPNPFAAIPETVFMQHIQEMARWYFWAVTVFWVSLITFVLYFVLNIWRSFAPAGAG